MNSYFYRNFPRIVLIFIACLVAIWGLIWWSGIPQRQANYQDHLAKLGVISQGEIRTGGFPSYYKFSQEGGHLAFDGVNVAFGAFSAYIPLERGDRILVRSDEPIELETATGTASFQASPTRVEVNYDADGNVKSLVVDAHEARLEMDGKTSAWQRLVLAQDNTRSPRWALRLTSEGQTDEVLGADDFNTLLSQVSDNYLQ